jgi:hypothetical protein
MRGLSEARASRGVPLILNDDVSGRSTRRADAWRVSLDLLAVPGYQLAVQRSRDIGIRRRRQDGHGRQFKIHRRDLIDRTFVLRTLRRKGQQGNDCQQRGKHPPHASDSHKPPSFHLRLSSLGFDGQCRRLQSAL